MEVSPDNGLYLQLARSVTHLSRAIHRRIDPQLRRQLGINGRELFVLRAVETGESNPMRIGVLLDIAPSSASRSVDRLVESGLLDRTGDPDDRRKTRLALTARGRQTVEKAREHVAKTLSKAYSTVGRSDIENAVGLLARLLEHTETGTQSPPAGEENLYELERK